jgi:L-seryl-tRNA(Ser) seleniumtransferase
VPAAARAALAARVEPGRSQVGGGALPLAELPTAVIALGGAAHSAATLDARLRRQRPPVVGRIAGDRLLLDCRTVADDEVGPLAAALTQLAAPEA